MKTHMPHFQPGSLVVDSYSTNHKILHLSSTSQIHQHLHKHGNCTYHEAVQSNWQLTVTSETCTLILFFCLHPGVLSRLFLWDFLPTTVHILPVYTWILHTTYLNFLVKLLCMKCLPLFPYFSRLIPNTGCGRKKTPIWEGRAYSGWELVVEQRCTCRFQCTPWHGWVNIEPLLLRSL